MTDPIFLQKNMEILKKYVIIKVLYVIFRS